MDYFSIFLSRQQVKDKWIAMKNQLCAFCYPNNTNAVEGIEMPALHPNRATRPAKPAQPDQRA